MEIEKEDISIRAKSNQDVKKGFKWGTLFTSLLFVLSLFVVISSIIDDDFINYDVVGYAYLVLGTIIFSMIWIIMIRCKKYVRSIIKKLPIIIPGIISIIMLFVAIPKGLPYDYYILLRWVVFVTAIYTAWFAYDNEKTAWVWPMGAVGLLFNPLFPVYLSKQIWIYIDPTVAVFLLIGLIFIKEKK